MGERIGQLFSGFAAGKAASGGSPRPTPRPTMPGTSPAPGTGSRGIFASEGGGGLFSGMSPQDRHQMVMQLIGNATQQAQGASPIANMLAPIAGALVGGVSGSKLGNARTEANQSALDTIMSATGGRLSPQAMDALGQLENNDMLSDPIRSILRSTVTDSLKPPAVGRGGGGRGSGGLTAADDASPVDPLAGLSASQQRNLLGAEESVRAAISDLVLMEGMTPEEAQQELRSRPGWETTFGILDRYRGGGTTGGTDAPVTSAAPNPAPGVNVDPNDPLGLRLPPA